MAKTYKPKLKKIDAVQWDGANNQEVADFLMSGPDPLTESDFSFDQQNSTSVLKVAGMTAYVNWWVIMEDAGNFVVIDPDQFAEKYEED